MGSLDPNTVQAWSAIAQAVAAILALITAVAVPYIQRAVEAKIRIKINPGMLWIIPDVGNTGPAAYFSADIEKYEPNFDRHGECYPCIDIINNSVFPIKVTDVGVIQGKKRTNRSAFLGATFAGSFGSTLRKALGESFGDVPCTVDPMSSKRIVFTDSVFSYSYSEKTLAYARIANGYTSFAKAPVWNFLARHRKTAENREETKLSR